MLARTILIARASRQSARQATAPAHIAAQCSWLHTSAPSAHDGPGPGPPHRSPSSDQQRRRAPFGEQREQRNQQPNHSSSSPYGNRSNNIGNAHNGDGYPPRHQRGPRPPAGPGSRARPGSREARFGGGGPVPSPRDWASGGRPGAGAKSELREERFGERAGGSSASASGSGPLRSFQGGSRERATPSASSDTADPVPEESLGNDRNGTDTRGPSQRGKGQVKKTGRGSLLDSVHESRNGDGKRGKGKERDAGGGGQATKHGKGTTKGKGKESRGKMQKEVQKQVFLPGVIAVSNLARVLGIKLRTLQTKMEQAGMTDTRPDLLLKFEDAELLAAEYNLTCVPNEEAAFDIYPQPPPADPSKLPLRPPVVTIMGHVDHGKTTLLDTLRSTSVASGEAGGITQHIGAFSVPVTSRGDASASASASASSSEVRTVTFLDTPGHAAFTAMRSRGASVTDIVVLVVAADDGVMPQTLEVIELVRSLAEGGLRKGGQVQLVVALNKMDKPDAEPERVKHALLAAGVELEEFGGEVPCVPVSGKTGMGLPELEETLATLAEMADLRAERDGPAEGYVIESRVDKGRGNVATVLVKRGALRPGECVVAGNAWCRVRQITDSTSRVLKSAGPGDPVLVTGWRELPSAGDELLGSPDEESAKRAVENRKASEERRALMRDVEVVNERRRLEAEAVARKEREEKEERARRRAARENPDEVEVDPVTGAPILRDPSRSSNANAASASENADTAADAEAFGTGPEARSPDYKELRLVVKADFSGTVEAVVGAISGIGNNEAGVKVVASGVGDPSEGDVALADAVGGHVLGFNVKPSRSVLRSASRCQPPISIHCDTVIYRLMSHVSTSVASLLPPAREYRVLGEANVAHIFSINVAGRKYRNVAGCRVVNGVVGRANKVRVLRGPERKVVYEGTLDQLKHVKKDIPEARKGTECGMAFEGFESFQVDDTVQAFQVVEVPRSL